MNTSYIAANDFSRARNRATLAQIKYFMNAEKNRLLSFHDVKDILKPKNQVYMGSQTVPIARIVGSEGRYRDFNRFFLPRSDFLRNRWESINRAQISDIPLPAIRLYEIGGVYFVRDGNHRVSVARYEGVEEIDAEVISLSTEIKINPSMTPDELAQAVINYEKILFYQETFFGILTGDNTLNFTQPGRYDLVYHHIEAHKYYLNQEEEEELLFEEALVSWYNDVYKPIIKIIEENKIGLNFPGRSSSDLYVWIVQHWDFLKKENGFNFALADAARDFSERYGNSKGRFFRFLAALLSKLFRPRRRRRSRRKKRK